MTTTAQHTFLGKWITSEEFCNLQPRNVFHRQLEPLPLDCSEHRNRHVLFRKSFVLPCPPKSATLFISADDYYKLYVNGQFVAQGPAPSYHFQYNYNEIDLSPYLQAGENTLAIHTLYQGLINRVWQSGDLRHGLICDLIIGGETVACSDESFLVATHSGYTELGVTGKHQTQFLERYDSRAPEVGFEQPAYDDRTWKPASLCQFDDHVLTAQKTHALDFEEILPQSVWTSGNCVRYDFGANYVGSLSAKAFGKNGDLVTVRCAQELNEDNSLRFDLRANCKYEEEWILSEKNDALDWFDYKAFRYVELQLPPTARVFDVRLLARHYPFRLQATLKKNFQSNSDLQKIWELCVHTQKYGVQEVIQDCMDREKGFYLGDGCYTALTHMVLTHDDSMVRKLIDDAFASACITDTLVTCLDCSFMQEIAEYPLILVFLVLWHYRLTGDKGYLRENYQKVTALLNAYRRSYETDCLLRDLDKWCVVEWPKNFQHGYDVDVRERQICHDAHVSINAYYLEAVRTANRIAKILGQSPYRDEAPLYQAFLDTFYLPEKGVFRDGEHTDHVSLVGNSFVYGFGLYPNEACRQNILRMIDESRIDSLSFFCTFPVLMGFVKDGDEKRLKDALLCDGAWLRMLREDATTTFEGWGKETKKNASLFHLTMSYAALFMASEDLVNLFGNQESN